MKDKATDWHIGLIVAVVALVLIVWSLLNSRKESAEMKALDKELSEAAESEEK